MKNIHLIKEEYIKCGDCNKHYLCTTCGAQCGSEGHFIEISIQKQHLIDMMRYDEELGLYEEPKQEIIDEVSVRNWFNDKFKDNSWREGFKAGEEWQAERMYSEKEVLAMLIIKHDALTAEYVLEIFKKR